MKLHKLLPILASAALAACLPRLAPTTNTPTARLATISALLPTTLAAYPLPTAATPEPSATPFPSPTQAAYPGPGSLTPPAFQPTVTPVAFTPLPPAPIIGRHVVQPGETIFCIARAYGVLPAAIAQANGLTQTFFFSEGQVLLIPAVQWTNMAAGPVCAPQFQSPFPGLPAPTAAPAGPALAVRLDYHCFANCGSKDGTYELHVDVLASGGVVPYTFVPAQSFDLTLPHCNIGQGLVAVASADGQTAQAAWTYLDTACP
jgi:LysM repeat protein